MSRILTLLLEGPHRVGKSTSIDLICKATQFHHVMIDRGWASNYAFAKIFKRGTVSKNILKLAIADYFSNPTAYVVYYALGSEDYEIEKHNDSHRAEQWVGLQRTSDIYTNIELDRYLQEAIDIATSLGYGHRILVLTARESEPEAQAQQILNWLSTK